jgi:hypothetical protein
VCRGASLPISHIPFLVVCWFDLHIHFLRLEENCISKQTKKKKKIARVKLLGALKEIALVCFAFKDLVYFFGFPCMVVA